MSTALTVYLSNFASSFLATAKKLYVASGSPGTTNIDNTCGTSLNFGQLTSDGSGSWAGTTTIPAEDGHGWILEDATLDGQQILAGNWTGEVRLASVQSGVLAGTLTVDIHLRLSKYSSGTFTTIVEMILTGQTVNATATNFVLPSTAGIAMNFAAGEKLYLGVWPKITTNGNANSGEGIRIFALSTNNSTFLGDSRGSATSPGYQPTPVLTTSPTTLSFTDVVGGSNPASQNDTLSETSGTGTAWTSNIAYGSGSGWLAISPTSGTLAGSGNQVVAFSCTTGALAAGTYTATVTFTATTGGATATVGVTFVVTAPVGPPGYNVQINGVSVMVAEGSFQEDDSISSVSTVSFVVRDDAGTSHFTKGMPVSISSAQNGLLYTGFVSAAVEDRVSPQTLIKTSIGARDNHTLAENRTYDGAEFTNQYAIASLVEMLNVLSQEGITAHYASMRDTTAADFNAGTLSNTIGTSNVGDGDLELSPAGTVVTILEDTTAEFSTGTLIGVTASNNTLTPTPATALKLVATCSQPGSSNAYTYVKIWGGSHTIPSSEFCSYDVFVRADSPSGQVGVDFVFSDGTTWRDTFVYPDVQNVGPHPNNDVGPMGIGQWYHRLFFMGNYSGKTISTVTVVAEGNNVGVYTAYFKNIRLDNSAFYFFQTSLQQTPQQLQNNGYSSALVSVVNAYDFGSDPRRISTAYSIDAAKILQSSAITWDSVEPDGTEILVQISYAGGIYQTCTKNAPLPGFVAGANIAGQTLTVSEVFKYDPAAISSSTPANPELAPVLNALEITVAPSYNATKTDVLYEVASNADWVAGSFTNMSNNGGTQAFLKGFTRNWDDGGFNNQTLWSTGASQSPDRQRFEITVGNGTDARSQFVDAGTLNDFTAEVDILVDSSGDKPGLTYRTTHWENANNTFGYIVEVTTTTIAVLKGSNSGTPSLTAVGSPATLAITSGNWHRLKCVIVGSNHKIYLDDVLYLNLTDASYSSGGIGLRIYNNTGSTQTAYFDNFGVMNSGSSLTGNWVSPAKSLAAAGTYGNSIITWRDLSADPGNTDTLLVETQVDGSTWQTATNGAAIPNLVAGSSLSGVNLKVRMTLTTTTASTMPGVDSLQVWVASQINATGTWVSPVLSLSTVGRLGGSVVGWNAALLTGCTLGVDARVDVGSWVDVTSSPGGPVPGLTAQSLPALDSFDTNTSANYTNTFMSGGAAGSATFDTANSRLILTGGTNQVEEYNALSFSDGYVETDMDWANIAGPVLRYVDANNCYFLKISDDQGTNPQTIQLFKNNGGLAQIGATVAIGFLRGTIHRIHFEISGTAITVNFDGLQVISATDASIAGPGKAGLFQNNKGQFYSIRVQPFGQDVTSHTIQTRLRLGSTTPLATPQVLDHALLAFNPNLSQGALIPQTAFFHQYIDKNIDTLAGASDAWWYIDKNLNPFFLPMNALPAPWVASDGGIPANGSAAQGDFLDSNITVEDSSDLYRNRSIIDNVLAPTTIDEKRIGDGVSTSWTFGNQWAGIPTILVNGVAASVGVKNIDTGKDFYYAVGDNTIAEDSSGPLYDFTFTLSFSGPGQYLTYSQADNLTEQAALAAIQGRGTGIVTIVEDGTGLTKAQGDTLAQARVDKYSVRGRLLKATTRRYGLAPGQLLTVFLPSHKLFDTPMLIRSVHTTLTTEFGIQQGWYTIEAISGPDVGTWEKLYERSTQTAA